MVVVNTEYDDLIAELKKFRPQITALTTKRDELKYHECKKLVAEYNSMIGGLELEALTARLAVLEL